ncbi:hypothetical protein X759_34920 [Mesorhizobium sp. LSHC420B00]|nr:hypothetical protein X759_34920 [Mesorhizobium sp. LSHC420B00]
MAREGDMAKVAPPDKSAIASITKLKGSAPDFGDRYRREEDLRPTPVMLDTERCQLSDQAASSWVTQTQIVTRQQVLRLVPVLWNR